MDPRSATNRAPDNTLSAEGLGGAATDKNLQGSLGLLECHVARLILPAVALKA